MQARYIKYTYQFIRPAGTSRGILKTKDSYFLVLEESGCRGIGECGLLRGLSADDRPDYEKKLANLCKDINEGKKDLFSSLIEFPSIEFGLEMALLDLKAKDHILFESDFSLKEKPQPINGLIWMGDSSFMSQQIEEKLNSGFKLLKMKVGAIDFENELTILKEIRKRFGAADLELRLDANGAFGKDALEKLKSLSEYGIHSIEQPVAKGQNDLMANLIVNSPIDIALDEELIGVFNKVEKKRLLTELNPKYIILKPSFIGGIRGSEEWIEIAEKQNIKWWSTSALEGNIGLSAIAQWNATKNNPMASGLGTGSLYHNNIPSPLEVKGGAIRYSQSLDWDLSPLNL